MPPVFRARYERGLLDMAGEANLAICIATSPPQEEGRVAVRVMATGAFHGRAVVCRSEVAPRVEDHVVLVTCSTSVGIHIPLVNEESCASRVLEVFVSGIAARST